VLFTSRQALPEPFAGHALRIGRLERREAVELVAGVLGRREQAPRADDPGESDDEITRLVDAVGCHARSLSRLAREVAASGVRVTTEVLGQLMARLHARHPDDRERSLYASVELSLRRLPAGLREAIRPLGVFQGGGQLTAMSLALGWDLDEHERMKSLAAALVNVGLAEPVEYGYLRLDPALGPLLLSEMSDAERDAATERWAQAMAQLTKFLYKQQFGDDPRMATTLTRLDLANLLGALEHIGRTARAEVVVGMAGRLESLLQALGRPKALARASRVREAAMAGLGDWSHARFTAESQAVDRLIEAGRFGEAVTAAQAILQRALSAGDDAYSSAAYDIALAHMTLGRALKEGGDAAAALAPLREARQHFQDLADAGNLTAARMASASITHAADCLRALGQLDEAASAYEEAIRLGEQRGYARAVAISGLQLGTVRMLQERYADALSAYTHARATFETLGEPRTVAIAWHQIGMVHERSGQHAEAEKAYQTSLRLRVPAGDRPGEAGTLGQLGSLYDAMGRLEDAVCFSRRAAATYRDLRDSANEARACSNLADTLVKLERYDDARREVLRAIECKQAVGHTVAPWTTFGVLARIQFATGNNAAAEAARQQAIDAYLAYRRDGGESYRPGAKLCAATAQAIARNEIPAALAGLTEVEQRPGLPAEMRPLIPKLRAILTGSRDPALATDPALGYDDAVELLLLLDHITPSTTT
jgi:tetratricopeptide (TPR) repeat protein